jgi:short-subunit dehydrogenase
LSGANRSLGRERKPALTYRGKTALVTGASSGIGEAFAREIAARGMDVILVARSEDRLRELADEVSREHDIRAEVVRADLGEEDGASTVSEALGRRARMIDLLVNNAGFGSYGPFGVLDPRRQHQEFVINVGTVVDLTRAVLPGMLDKGEGAIINVASTMAFQPGPYMAVYGASKAFVLSFSEALWAEYRKQGVRVLAFCPGPVATGFWGAQGGDPRFASTLVSLDDAERVVRVALKALERGRPYVVPGLRNYLFAQGSRFTPRAWVARLSELSMRPRRSFYQRAPESEPRPSQEPSDGRGGTGTGGGGGAAARSVGEASG